jgi:hypothetical protein
MSDVEIERRNLTGTLMSSSVAAKTTKMLAIDPQAILYQAKVRQLMHRSTVSELAPACCALYEN